MWLSLRGCLWPHGRAWTGGGWQHRWYVGLRWADGRWPGHCTAGRHNHRRELQSGCSLRTSLVLARNLGVLEAFRVFPCLSYARKGGGGKEQLWKIDKKHHKSRRNKEHCFLIFLTYLFLWPTCKFLGWLGMSGKAPGRCPQNFVRIGHGKPGFDWLFLDCLELTWCS